MSSYVGLWSFPQRRGYCQGHIHIASHSDTFAITRLLITYTCRCQSTALYSHTHSSLQLSGLRPSPCHLPDSREMYIHLKSLQQSLLQSPGLQQSQAPRKPAKTKRTHYILKLSLQTLICNILTSLNSAVLSALSIPGRYISFKQSWLKNCSNSVNTSGNIVNFAQILFKLN